MCGIAGLFLSKKNKGIKGKFIHIKNTLKHRGPDGNGIFENDKVSLVHTRLSIVDLKKGYQPINNNKLILVANGEIYNDPELRNQYSDFNFKTNSDSESILAVYQSKGLEGFEELRGMYAFALFDTEKDQLIISRDEFGIKPLYFSVFEDGIIFCSELNPLKKYIPFKTELENKKVIEHLQYQYCTGNKTIFKNINRLRPGETLIIKNGKIIESKFRTLKVKRKNTINDKFFKRNILNSVSSHLRSDVPYCLFFSGGIDSMLLLYCIKQLKVKNVTAFTINFENKTDNNLKNICTKNNIKLRELNFLENDFWDLIFFAAEKVDDPIADYAILPTIKLSEIASKDFKVVITGEGGDELFGGYGRYKKTQRIFFRGSEKKETFKVGRYFQKLDTINSDFNKKSHLFEYKNVTRLQKKQLLDYKNWLPNNLLIKLDRCLMAYSLEGRTPFIDKNLFKEFFFIKDNMKVRSGFGKFYVRKFLKNNLHNYNSFSPKKGFSVPINEWIPKKIETLRECFHKLEFLFKFFTRRDIDLMCDQVKNNKRASKRIWHIIFFSSWYLIHVEGLKRRGNYFEVLKRING